MPARETFTRPPGPNAAAAARSAALAAATAMLLGLTGGVIGGWIASEKPMTVRGIRRVVVETERRVP
jgi:ABC-type amino acid transport system permease subunit